MLYDPPVFPPGLLGPFICNIFVIPLHQNSIQSILGVSCRVSLRFAFSITSPSRHVLLHVQLPFSRLPHISHASSIPLGSSCGTPPLMRIPFCDHSAGLEPGPSGRNACGRCVTCQRDGRTSVMSRESILSNDDSHSDENVDGHLAAIPSVSDSSNTASVTSPHSATTPAPVFALPALPALPAAIPAFSAALPVVAHPVFPEASPIPAPPGEATVSKATIFEEKGAEDIVDLGVSCEADNADSGLSPAEGLAPEGFATQGPAAAAPKPVAEAVRNAASTAAGPPRRPPTPTLEEARLRLKAVHDMFLPLYSDCVPAVPVAERGLAFVRSMFFRAFPVFKST